MFVYLLVFGPLASLCGVVGRLIWVLAN